MALFAMRFLIVSPLRSVSGAPALELIGQPPARAASPRRTSCSRRARLGGSRPCAPRDARTREAISQVRDWAAARSALAIEFGTEQAHEMLGLVDESPAHLNRGEACLGHRVDVVRLDPRTADARNPARDAA